MSSMAKAAAFGFALLAASPVLAQEDSVSASADGGAAQILPGLMSSSPVARVQRLGGAAPSVALPPDSGPVSGLGTSSTATLAPDAVKTFPSLVPSGPLPPAAQAPEPDPAPAQPTKPAVFAPPANPTGSVIRGEARVLDGDTLSVRGVTIRLSGVDAMDLKQTCWSGGLAWACGQKAVLRLDELADGKLVRCVVTKPEPTWVTAVCETAGTDLAKAMVRDGLALPLAGASSDYVRTRDEARAARSGVWVGEFQAPWEWRKPALSASGSSNR